MKIYDCLFTRKLFAASISMVHGWIFWDYLECTLETLETRMDLQEQVLKVYGTILANLILQFSCILSVLMHQDNYKHERH